MENSMTQPMAKNPVLLLETTMGDIKLELFPDKAPVTVDNFLTYVREGIFEGLTNARLRELGAELDAPAG